jgi:hypothetical protein
MTAGSTKPQYFLKYVRGNIKQINNFIYRANQKEVSSLNMTELYELKKKEMNSCLDLQYVAGNSLMMNRLLRNNRANSYPTKFYTTK